MNTHIRGAALCLPVAPGVIPRRWTREGREIPPIISARPIVHSESQSKTGPYSETDRVQI